MMGGIRAPKLPPQLGWAGDFGIISLNLKYKKTYHSTGEKGNKVFYGLPLRKAPGRRATPTLLIIKMISGEVPKIGHGRQPVGTRTGSGFRPAGTFPDLINTRFRLFLDLLRRSAKGGR